MDEHYFSADPSVEFKRVPVHASVWGRDLELTSGSGVFAQGRLDIGTAVLFRETDPPEGGSLLDLGCGYGVIGCALAVAAPSARVYGVDVNERAVLLANENAAADQLLGLGDFLAFCKPREGSTTVRTLQEFAFERRDDGVVIARVRADAFCHNMVRALIGSALRVGEGLESVEWLHERMLARVRDAKTRLAPAHPLVLEEVGYPESAAEMAERAELTRALREEIPGG